MTGFENADLHPPTTPTASLPSVGQNQFFNSSVTVGIPVFNGEAGIVRAIGSAQGQDWQGSLDILVVDDGSTDRTREIVTALQREDSRIRLVAHPKNLGRPAARNTILRNATGEFLTWLDADDEWHPQKISRQMAALVPAAAEFGDDVITMCAFHWRWDSGREYVVNPHISDDHLRDFLSGKLGAYLWSMVGPTKAFRNTGEFDLGLPRLQDLDFLIRFAGRGGKIVPTALDVPLCTYFKTNDNRPGRLVAASFSHLWRKHAAAYHRYGREFALRCRRNHYRVAARHSRANGERGYRLYAKLAALFISVEKTAVRLLGKLRPRPVATHEAPARPVTKPS